jgi:KEOPS complex subunit Cgi121
MDLILGASGILEDLPATVARLRQQTGGQVLILDAGKVLGEDHLRSAVLHARRAMTHGTASCDLLALEVLIYASGERQISKAKEKMDPVPGHPIAIVILDARGEPDLEGEGLRKDQRVLLPSMSKALAFGLTPVEIEAAGGDWLSLALERVAMVEVLKR